VHSQSVESPLVCNLDRGHPGLHYDSQEDISWKEGGRDE
jgi:hypothetical protein